jgi:hypothetical protein
MRKIWGLIFVPQEYKIKKALLLYSRAHYSDHEDVTYEYRMDGPKGVLKDMSGEVTEYMFDVTYLYKGKTYVLLSRNPDHVFPPVKPRPSFRLAIKEAFLLDQEDVPFLNVTEDFKQYEGPHLDFHGETIALKDMCDSGRKLRLVNVLGAVVDYTIETDSISHQTIWSPGKT